MFEMKVIDPTENDDEKGIDAQLDLLRVAARAFKKHERLKAELKQHERHMSLICQTYGNVYKVWGFRPEHLRQACVARGLLK
jgi:hypothetical protein